MFIFYYNYNIPAMLLPFELIIMILDYIPRLNQYYINEHIWGAKYAAKRLKEKTEIVDWRGSPVEHALKTVLVSYKLNTISKNAFCNDIYKHEYILNSIDDSCKHVMRNFSNNYRSDYIHFYWNESICDIIIPTSIKHILSLAFGSCRNLTKVTLPTNLNYLGKAAFMLCDCLKTINIPPEVDELSESLFLGCSSLETIEDMSGVKKIAPAVFAACRNLKRIQNSDQLTIIERDTFYGCHSLESFEFSPNLTHIGYRAFSICQSLNEINLSQTKLTELGEMAFAHCHNIKLILLPNTLEKIGKLCFIYCYSLVYIKIPFSTYYIGDDAFAETDELETLLLPNNNKINNIRKLNIGENTHVIQYDE
jgi:hypothetical protein